MSNTLTQQDTFKIQIGTFEREYVLWETSAPPTFDGFGAFTVRESGVQAMKTYSRVVLVPVESMAWQEARYCSGLHAPVVREMDDLVKGYITEQLIKRLTTGGGA